MIVLDLFTNLHSKSIKVKSDTFCTEFQIIELGKFSRKVAKKSVKNKIGSIQAKIFSPFSAYFIRFVKMNIKMKYLTLTRRV